MSTKSLPVEIQQDISIYLGPDEKILKYISSVSGKFKAIGELWLILTTDSIFFHTREFKKEPVIALLPKKDIKVIEYFQKTTEIVLTFKPKKAIQSTTKLSFPIDKKGEVENFCEDLADYIDFKKETKEGIKSYGQTAKAESTQTKVEEKTSSTKKSPTTSGSSVKSTSKESTKPIVTANPKPKPEENKPAASPKKDFGPKITKNISPTQTKEAASKNKELEIGSPKFVLIATLISVIVAFIWYSFFKAISRR